MSTRSTGRGAGVAAALGCVFCLTLLLIAGWLHVVAHSGAGVAGQDLALALTCPLVAAALLGRQPRNRVGQLLMVTGVGTSVVMVSGEYAAYALQVRHGSVPAGIWALWLSDWIWVPGFSSIVLFLTLVFPSGRLASQRWVPLARFNAALAVGLVLAAALHPGHLGDDPRSPLNPLGVLEFPGSAAAVTALSILSMLSALTCMGGLIQRMRTSSGVERAQLKWFAYSATIAVVTLLLGGFGFGSTLSDRSGLPVGTAMDVVSAVALGALPVAIGVAVMRYRLYEIDRLVSRTLTYTAVTGVLGTTYAGLVTAVSRLTESNSSLAVASSTLAVAALFQPLRRRVQSAVDRRFNRSRYDAERTVEAFARRLREQVDLDVVRSELLATARETMQPATAALWLRSAEKVAPLE